MTSLAVSKMSSEFLLFYLVCFNRFQLFVMTCKRKLSSKERYYYVHVHRVSKKNIHSYYWL